MSARTSKSMDDVLEFLRSFIAGGVNQDFKPWANELYQKLYRTSDEACDHYWGRHDIRCELPPSHRGEDHYYLVPGYAIRTDVKFEPAWSQLKALP